MTQPCCMLVEDQALIGMALEASLEEAGFDVSGPFSTNREALAWLDRHTPDLALLDVMLRDGPCLDIARALKSRGVPFAIYSGLRPDTQAPEFRGAPWLKKPAGRDELARVLGELRPARKLAS